jgi:hypothetical protein
MFDPSTVESSSFGILPKGKYIATISDVELKDTKAGTGKYLSFEFKVKEGEFKGRNVFANYNVVNPNPTAQQIGREGLKNIAECVNVKFDKTFDTDKLLGKVLMIAVSVKEFNGKESNNVDYVGQSELHQKTNPSAPMASFETKENPFHMNDTIPF